MKTWFSEERPPESHNNKAFAPSGPRAVRRSGAGQPLSGDKSPFETSANVPRLFLKAYNREPKARARDCSKLRARSETLPCSVILPRSITATESTKYRSNSRSCEMYK